MASNLDTGAPTAARHPRFVWFDGILTGPREAADSVAREVEAANREGLVSISLDTEPSRIALLLSDRSLDGRQVTGDCRETFTTTMRRIVGSAPGARNWESTFRCTEVFEDEVRESLFTVRDGEVVCLSRARPPREDDLTRAPRMLGASSEPRPWGTIAIIGALLLFAFGLTTWQAGWIDRVFAARGQTLRIEAGPLTDLVDASIEDSWGLYKISLLRGKKYPVTKEQSTALTQAAQTPVDVAATSAVVNGNNIFLRIEDESGEVLASKEVSLRQLLTTERMNDVAELPGRIGARKLVLGLDAGKKPPR